MIHYGKAVAYNTPYISVKNREFAERGCVGGRGGPGTNRLEKIYLLDAVEPGLEAFEIYPACVMLLTALLVPAWFQRTRIQAARHDSDQFTIPRNLARLHRDTCRCAGPRARC